MRPSDATTPGAPDTAAPIDALERVIARCDAAGLPPLIGALERLKTHALARLVGFTTNARPDRVPTDPVDDLRHLTPLQVAELLNLKEAYIHELCRSSQMPAVKGGKYWIIPVGALREWLKQARRGIDPRRAESLPWPDREAAPARSSGAPRPGRAAERPGGPGRRQPRAIRSMNTQTRKAMHGRDLPASPEAPSTPRQDS